MDDDKDVDIGFIPSSFSNRQSARPKRVRNISQQNTSSSGAAAQNESSRLDELDRMMGLLGGGGGDKSSTLKSSNNGLEDTLGSHSSAGSGGDDNDNDKIFENTASRQSSATDLHKPPPSPNIDNNKLSSTSSTTANNNRLNIHTGYNNNTDTSNHNNNSGNSNNNAYSFNSTPRSAQSSPHTPRDKKEDHDEQHHFQVSPNTISRHLLVKTNATSTAANAVSNNDGSRGRRPNNINSGLSGLDISFDSSDDGNMINATPLHSSIDNKVAVRLNNISNNIIRDLSPLSSAPASPTAATHNHKQQQQQQLSSPKQHNFFSYLPESVHGNNNNSNKNDISHDNIFNTNNNKNSHSSIQFNHSNTNNSNNSNSFSPRLNATNTASKVANNSSNDGDDDDMLAMSYRDRKRLELNQDVAGTVTTVTNTNNNKNNATGHVSQSKVSHPMANNNISNNNNNPDMIATLQKTIESLEYQLRQQQQNQQPSSSSLQLLSEEKENNFKHQLASLQKDKETLSSQLITFHEISAKCKLQESLLHDYQQQIKTLTEQREEYKQNNILVDMEKTKLQEEMITTSLKHNESLNYYKQRNEVEKHEIEKKYTHEIHGLEKRHEETIKGLKKIHEDEIENIKDRMKQSISLENMSNQIKSTSGSIKLIEEQLNARYKGVEAARQGQMEARERLLSEMEERAKERSDVAETETFRLKGMLVHMESVVNNLRSQSAEEKERLRLEHNRLQSLQSSLESERQSFQKTTTEETLILRSKYKELQDDKLRWLSEKQVYNQEMAILKQQLEHDRQEFTSSLLTSNHTTEMELMKLKEEERSLRKLRDEILCETKIFEQKKFEIQRETQELESFHTSVLQFNEKSRKEKIALDTVAQELKKASEHLQQESNILKSKEEELLHREKVLQQNKNDIKFSTDMLTKREFEIRELIREVENKMVRIEDEDQKLIEKRLTIATAHRELLSNRAQSSTSRLLTMPQSNNHGNNNPNHTVVPNNNNYNAMRQSWSGPLTYTTAPSSTSIRTGYRAHQQQQVPPHPPINNNNINSNDSYYSVQTAHSSGKNAQQKHIVNDNRNISHTLIENQQYQQQTNQSSQLPLTAGSCNLYVPSTNSQLSNKSVIQQQTPSDITNSVYYNNQAAMIKEDKNFENILNTRLLKTQQQSQQSHTSLQAPPPPPSWQAQFESALNKTSGVQVMKRNQAKQGSILYEVQAAKNVLKESAHYLSSDDVQNSLQ